MERLTRRDFAKKLASITACFGALPILGESSDSYPSRGLRRGLGMRMGMFAGGGEEEIELCPDGIVKNGLIAYWNGYENAGWNTHDTTVRCVDLMGNCGSLTNFNALASRGMTFTKALNCKITTPAQIVSAFQNDITIEIIVQSGYAGSASNQWTAFIVNSSGVYFRTRQSTLSIQAIPGVNVSSVTLPVNSMTYRHRSTGAASLVVDGSTEYTGTASVPSSFADFYIGSSAGSAYNYLIGTIHAIRIYNRAITEEMRQINRAVDISMFGIV